MPITHDIEDLYRGDDYIFSVLIYDVDYDEYTGEESQGDPIDIAAMGWEFSAQISTKHAHRGGEAIGSAVISIDPDVINKLWIAFPAAVTALIPNRGAVWDLELRAAAPSVPEGLDGYTQTLLTGDIIDPGGEAVEA